jgi:DNA-binding NarL/FixJ family response regulator
MLRVLVAEGNSQTRAALRDALVPDTRLEICAEAGDAAQAVAAAVRKQPDLCVLDVRLPGGGLAAAWEIGARLPRAKVVMLTDSTGESDLFAALRAGAEGYLLKTMDLARLPDTLNGVWAGQPAMDAAFFAPLFKHFRARDPRWRRPVGRMPARTPASGQGSPGAHLTSREWEILQLLSDGLSTSDISRSLTISSSAVRVHVAAIVRKLGVSGRAAAVGVLRDTAQDRAQKTERPASNPCLLSAVM